MSVVAHPGAATRARDTGRLLAAGAAAAAAVAYVGAVDPNESGHYPTCPFLFLTGLYCPGCGSLRAVHALAHGDVATAVDRNVLAVVAGVLVVGIWLGALARAWRGTPRRTVAPPGLLWAGAVVVVLFAVVRNLPFGAALAP